MGKKVENGDYAKPLFTRLYKGDRKMLDELVASYPMIKIKEPRKGRPEERVISDAEVVRDAIKNLHKQRVS